MSLPLEMSVYMITDNTNGQVQQYQSDPDHACGDYICNQQCSNGHQRLLACNAYVASDMLPGPVEAWPRFELCGSCGSCISSVLGACSITPQCPPQSL